MAPVRGVCIGSVVGFLVIEVLRRLGVRPNRGVGFPARRRLPVRLPGEQPGPCPAGGPIARRFFFRTPGAPAERTRRPARAMLL